jgi:hypothetical protein
MPTRISFRVVCSRDQKLEVINTAPPTWWLWRGGCTRSHSELGRETPQRRWYFVLRRGRVGRCQVCRAVWKLLSVNAFVSMGGALVRSCLVGIRTAQKKSFILFTIPINTRPRLSSPGVFLCPVCPVDISEPISQNMLRSGGLENRRSLQRA